MMDEKKVMDAEVKEVEVEEKVYFLQKIKPTKKTVVKIAKGAAIAAVSFGAGYFLGKKQGMDFAQTLDDCFETLSDVEEVIENVVEC